MVSLSLMARLVEAVRSECPPDPRRRSRAARLDRGRRRARRHRRPRRRARRSSQAADGWARGSSCSSACTGTAAGSRRSPTRSGAATRTRPVDALQADQLRSRGWRSTASRPMRTPTCAREGRGAGRGKGGARRGSGGRRDAGAGRARAIPAAVRASPRSARGEHLDLADPGVAGREVLRTSTSSSATTSVGRC